MDPEVNGEGSTQDRLIGDRTASPPVPGADGSLSGAVPSGASLPPPQTLPPQQAFPPQLTNPLGATESASTWPPTAAPAFGPMPGDYRQPAYPPAPNYGPMPGYPPQPGYPPPAGYMPPPVGYALPQAYPYPGYGYSPVPPGYGYGPAGWSSPVPPGPIPGLAWGGIGARAGALTLDLVFFCVFGVVLSGIMHTPGLQTINGTVQDQTLANVIDLASWLIVLLYVPVCWCILEGTPGQRLLGLRVVRASDGRKLGIGRILLRYVVWAFCLGALCIPAVIAAVIASDHPQKRAWTDFAGDSVVVRTV